MAILFFLLILLCLSSCVQTDPFGSLSQESGGVSSVPSTLPVTDAPVTDPPTEAPTDAFVFPFAPETDRSGIY